jgi:hypothetical protein
VNIFGADVLVVVFLIAPPVFSLPAKTTPEKLSAAAREWMRL